MFRNSSSRTPKHPIINPNQHDHSIYACECGKSYNNFPALYLHFQRKHSIKISTKEELSNRKVKFENSKRTVTYFYTSEQNLSQQIWLKRLREKWRVIIDQYEDKLEDMQGNDWSSLECLESLKVFVEEIQNQWFKSDENSQNRNMPYWFNRFLITRKKNLRSVESRRWCQTLIDFSSWQYKSNHSSIIIQINDDFQF